LIDRAPRIDVPRPDALEIASGMMLGREPGVRDLPRAPRGGTRPALEHAVARALARPPCVVSFSGGRDSSAVLALATAVARREGYDLPIPATHLYPDDPGTDESEWQRLVIDHLGLDEWIRISVGEELDLVGPVALEVLDRHGVLFPANAFAHVPLLRLARGGSLLCGVGGDEVFDSPAVPLLRMLRGYERPTRRGLRSTWRKTGYRSSEHLGNDAAAPLSWLVPSAQVEVAARAGPAIRAVETRWDIALRRWVADRYFLAILGTLVLLGRDEGVEVIVPFLDASVMPSLAADAGWAGFRSRTDALTRFVGDLLPPPVLQRTSKAVFTRAFRHGPTTRLLDEWDGSGVDPALVDADQLRSIWLGDSPDARTAMLLQQVAFAGCRSI
jgi:asparagine synthetase B (glutamine-hydrolysing)